MNAFCCRASHSEHDDQKLHKQPPLDRVVSLPQAVASRSLEFGRLSGLRGLGVARSRVRIVGGYTARRKPVEIDGITRGALDAAMT